MGIKDLLERWKDWTQRQRNWILYAVWVLTLLGTVAAWGLLPDRVAMQAAAGAGLVDKTTAIGANLGLTALFTLLFWRRPRELVYFVALCLAVALTFSLPVVNLAA